MGEAKLSMELSPGVTLGSRALREMRACDLNPLAVVVRTDDPLLWLCDRNDGAGPLPKFRIVPGTQSHMGMSRSIRSGLEALLPDDPDAILIALADQPFVTASLLNRLISVYLEDPSVDYAASGQGTLAIPPVIVSRSMFSRLCQLEGDTGARHLFKSAEYRGVVVRYAAEWAFVDVDTQEEMDKAKMIWSELQAKAR
jgi:molybdenum cofactor cytidylyltransferase